MSHKESSFIQHTPGVQDDIPTTNEVNNYPTYKIFAAGFYMSPSESKIILPIPRFTC